MSKLEFKNGVGQLRTRIVWLMTLFFVRCLDSILCRSYFRNPNANVFSRSDRQIVPLHGRKSRLATSATGLTYTIHTCIIFCDPRGREYEVGL